MNRLTSTLLLSRLHRPTGKFMLKTNRCICVCEKYVAFTGVRGINAINGRTQLEIQLIQNNRVAKFVQNHKHFTSRHSNFLIQSDANQNSPSQLVGCPGVRHFATDETGELDHVQYERLVNDALEDLTEFFESLDELENCPEEYDVQYSDGVLTVSLGSEHGTYVINKQSPNKQIWLSSPTSGPKRYDFVAGRWIYSHDGRALHDLLTAEISAIFQENLDFAEIENGSR